MPKISLVLTLYNAELYIRECLDSVVGQTFKDFECVCVNDGSTDETVKIVEEYALKDKRFRLISQQNAGCSMARNKGIDEAKGEYIALLDQDDVLHPQALEVLYYLIDTYKTDVATFQFKTVSDEFKMDNPKMHDYKTVPVEVREYLFKRFFESKKGSQVVVWTRLYKKSLLTEHGICFPKDVQPAEDTVFTLKVMHHARNMVSIPIELLFYRDSATSVMNEGKTVRYVRSHIEAARVLHDYFITSQRLEGSDLLRAEYYVSRIVFNTCISRVLKYAKDETVTKEAYVLVNRLFQDGVFRPKKLELKRFIVSKLFMSGKYKLAKMLL
jgi:glycosyltransferase involved in cell wall biosynthesis